MLKCNDALFMSAANEPVADEKRPGTRGRTRGNEVIHSRNFFICINFLIADILNYQTEAYLIIFRIAALYLLFYG